MDCNSNKERKTLKIRYVDWWPGFNGETFIFTEILRKHYAVEICDDAKIVFASCFGNDILDCPIDCVKIYFTGENITPDFNIFDYAIGFDYIDFGDRYLRYPLFLLYDGIVEKMLERGANDCEKTEFCSFVVSNGTNAAPERTEMFDLLSNYKKVNSGGRYMNNVGGPVADKYEFESKHKFCLCFENGSHAGYTTEKLVQAFCSGGVPIYWGGPLVTKVFNPKAFVNVLDFPSLQDAVNHIIEIDNNDSLYASMISEPVLLHEEEFMKQYDDLESFLLNIVSQPIEKAYRHDRVYQGVKHINNLRRVRENNSTTRKGEIYRRCKTKFLSLIGKLAH